MRENREKNDLVTKNFETFPDVAADIINALLHNGKLVVTKENLLPAPTESIYTSGENRLRNQLQDVVKYEMAGERIRAQYMIANQSDRMSKWCCVKRVIPAEDIGSSTKAK